MAKAKKSTLVCRPCGYGVTVSDLGSAIVECWECGVELVPGKTAAAGKLVAAKKPPAKAAAKRALPAGKTAGKSGAKKPAAKKAAPKKEK